MKNEAVISLIRDYRLICERIHDTTKVIREYKTLIDTERGLSGVCYDGVGGSGGISNPTARAVESIIEKFGKQLDKSNIELDRLFDERNAIDKLLNALNKEERQVIELKHIKRLKWSQVSYQINYHEGHARKIEAAAIDKMKGVVDHDEWLRNVLTKNR